jgi:putative peptidoglycan lipid II flippase
VILLLEPLQHCAIALSTSLCVLINFLFLSVALYRAVEGYRVFYLLQSFLKIAFISIAMGLGAQWLNKTAALYLPMNILGELCALLFTILASIIFYFTSIYFIKINEVDYLVPKVMARIKTLANSIYNNN